MSVGVNTIFKLFMSLGVNTFHILRRISFYRLVTFKGYIRYIPMINGWITTIWPMCWLLHMQESSCHWLEPPTTIYEHAANGWTSCYYFGATNRHLWTCCPRLKEVCISRLCHVEFQYVLASGSQQLYLWIVSSLHSKV